MIHFVAFTFLANHPIHYHNKEGFFFFFFFSVIEFLDQCILKMGKSPFVNLLSHGL
jgi:hypothetical protein